MTDFAYDSDTIARVPLAATMLAETPCTDILGLVIYDLPGRDCAAKASNGELASGQLSRYQTEYIDREYTSRRFCILNPDTN
jgi:cellulose 1,4-beta-cellobiosidase